MPSLDVTVFKFFSSGWATITKIQPALIFYEFIGSYQYVYIAWTQDKIYFTVIINFQIKDKRKYMSYLLENILITDTGKKNLIQNINSKAQPGISSV